MGEDVKELAKITEPEEYLIDDSMIIKPLPIEEAKKVEIVKGPNIKFLPNSGSTAAAFVCTGQLKDTG